MDQNRKKEIGSEIRSFVLVFVITAVVILLFVNFVAHPVTVVGRSMVPTLEDGEYGITNILGLTLNGVQRGDVVVVTIESDTNGDGVAEETHWVKRIIALPGETVQSIDGDIYVNGEVLDESAYIDEEYKQSLIDQFGYFNEIPAGDGTVTDFGPVTLSDDEYWVMGDNRPYSKDSRDSSVGPVTSDQLYGKSVLVLYPFSQLGVR